MVLLEVLLGKPGTLHSPGQIFPLGPGRPAGPKRCFRIFEDWTSTSAGWGCGCVPTDPAGRVCLSYQARGGPSPQAHMGPSLNPFALATLYLLFKSPSRVIIPHSGRRVWVKGRGAGWLIWCLHSTPQAATVRSRRLSISPLVLIGVSRVNRQNELALPRSVTALLLSVYFINLILLMSPDFSCWRPSHYLDPII